MALANAYNLGSNTVDKVYLGSDLVYTSTPASVAIEEVHSAVYGLSGTADGFNITG